jgi:transcriptional regulator with XRE-family HTH domain
MNVVTQKQSTDKAFTEWLKREMDTRRWRPVDLARASGVTLNQVVLVMKQKRRAGDRFLRGVATAFQMPQESVFRLAGMLNDQPVDIVKDDEVVRKARRLLASMDMTEREKAIHLLEQYAKDHMKASPRTRVSRSSA